MTTRKERDAERARRRRVKMTEAGLVQCNVWVPRGAEDEIRRAAELICANPDLRVSRLTDAKTGRMKGLK